MASRRPRSARAARCLTILGMRNMFCVYNNILLCRIDDFGSLHGAKNDKRGRVPRRFSRNSHRVAFQPQRRSKNMSEQTKTKRET